MGAHRLILKNYLYEEDLQVPLLVRGPKFPEGAVRDQPVSNVDLAPTIIELTRAQQGRLMDGRSLLGPANDPSAGTGREMLFERTGGDKGIRSGKWVLIDRLVGKDELYDLVGDPYQLNNAIDVPANAGVVDQLRGRLSAIRGCAGASCP
jgi:arylsulfatase A-like enzyme